jgi:LAGLIDADG DNA endonuclease family protein
VVAEGCFQVPPGASTSFSFVVALGATDREMVELLRDVLGCGRIQWRERRQPHYDDEVTFVVRRVRDLVEVIVPFMDEHLPMSYKRDQYEAWREVLLEYWARGVRRRRPCTIVGCTRVQRAKGLCRHHYYEALRR